MPLPVTGHHATSNKDVVSFTFDDPSYDVDRPVSIVQQSPTIELTCSQVLIDPAEPSVNFTHRSARRLVCALIAGLHVAGLKRGDTVCLHSFNSIVYPLLALAVIGAGGVSVGTNPSHTRYELNHSIQTAEVKFVIAEPEILDHLLSALIDSGIDARKRLFVLDFRKGQSVPSGLRSWRWLLRHGSEDWVRFNDTQKSRETTAQLYFTSGTSGLPKCAETSHQNLVAEHQIFYETNPRQYPFRIVLALPFFHVGVLPQALVSTIKQGREAYVMRRFQLADFLCYHAKYQITETFMVPPIVISVVQSGLADPESSNYDPKYSMRSVRNATTGAAACSPEILRKYQRLLAADSTVSQCWGMTETTSGATIMPAEIAHSNANGFTDMWRSVGRMVPETEIKLIDEEGNEVSSTFKGELCVRGPSIVRRYFKNEEATRHSWDSQGFFKSGDLVEITPDTGLIYIMGRRKELIKVRGFQVAPAELEDMLISHPEVLDAAVTGIKTREDVEMPKAYVVRRQGSTITGDQIKDYMGQRLARYKQLDGGVQFVDSIPRTPSGKVMKKGFQEMEEQGKTLQAKI